MRIIYCSLGSEEPGPRGLTYDESSVMYSLLWNQPSLYPSQNSYSLRHSNPLVRKGGQADAKTASTGLPLFYTDSLDQPLSEEEGERGSGGGEVRGGEAPEVIIEIHEEVYSFTGHPGMWSVCYGFTPPPPPPPPPASCHRAQMCSTECLHGAHRAEEQYTT